MIERDVESDELPGEVDDPLRLAIGRLIITIFDLSAADSAARARAVTEAIEVETRIRAALAPKPTIN
jgi:hypothetical protein